MDYQSFLKSKTKPILSSGFDGVELNKHLFDFQAYIVRLALKKGKFALFEDCGLGKTLQQLEWANQVSIYTNRPVIILAPLAVSAQTINEGEKFHIYVQKLQDAIDNNDINNCTQGVYISNYEQIENINASIFSGVVLDESSILKNYEGKIKNKIIEGFKLTPFKLACTATPSPNDPMELGNHAEFLNVMSRSEMLSMYFVHDGGDTSKWRLKGHSIDSFYDWVSEWSIMISNPADLGFNAENYRLPDLRFIEKKIETSKRDNGLLFNDIAVNASNFNQELRITLIERLDHVAELVNDSNENFIIWVKQNEEGNNLKKLIPGSVEVKGSDSNEYKEKMLIGFSNNEFRVLITKAKIAQFGMNFQNCNNQIFPSLDFSFESLYQSIRRSYRFGQNKPVNIYLITTDTMQNVMESIKKKQAKFEEMQKLMIKIIKHAA
jgi:hypothetical protein